VNDEELRKALRPSRDIDPLDPEQLIAGAHRRRRRGMAVSGAAAVAVLAVAAVGAIAGIRPSGSPVVEQPTIPPISTPTPPDSPAPNTPAPNTPPSTPEPPRTPGETAAELSQRCRLELGAGDNPPGPAASLKAILTSATSVNASGTIPSAQVVIPSTATTTLIVADSKRWGACDTGYGPGSLSVRQSGKVERPAATDTDAFAVANNAVVRAGVQYDYYWAAGLLPTGVKTVRYTFPRGGSENASITGKYWVMHHLEPAGAPSTPAPPRVEVSLLAANGSVVNEFQLKPGDQTCAQISHGC
jgi:hypothetical protein